MPGSRRSRGARPRRSTGAPTPPSWRAASPRPPSSRGRPAVPAKSSFDYAVLRVVPRVEREEFVNAGVILFCLERDFLEARVELDRARVLALWPAADLGLIDEHLAAVTRICRGGEGRRPVR